MDKAKLVMKIESYSSKDGMMLLSVNDYAVRAMLKGLVDLCDKKYSSYVKLEMSPPYRKRTLSQNDRWWAMCTDFGCFLGMSKDEVALGVKYRAMEEGLWKGEDMPFSKKGTKKPVSTTTADTKEMSVLIDVLYRIAAESGYTFEEEA
jgi:hypothetical protein